MKSIGIMTFSSSLSNYGQILQAFALQSYLIGQGYDAFLIHYDDAWKYFELRRGEPLAHLKYVLKNLPGMHTVLKNKIVRKEDLCRFSSFKSIHLIYGNTVYRQLKELKKNPPEADVYMTGSDQVWGKSIPNMEPYLLNFGNEHIPRIAYAASFGRTELSRQEIAYVTPLIKRYKAVGVREISGIDVCKKLGYTQAQFTPDPTILLTKEEWINIGGNHNPFKTDKKKIFIYSCYLPKGTLLEALKYIGGEKEVIVSDIVNSDPTYAHLSIEEWLGAIQNADYIITNSFHATMFSLYFNKSFVTFKYEQRRGGHMNTRLTSILSQTNLTERFLSFSEMVNSKKILDTWIDWDAVNQQLASLRDIGVDFLKKVL